MNEKREEEDEEKKSQFRKTHERKKTKKATIMVENLDEELPSEESSNQIHKAVRYIFDKQESEELDM